jgi:aspartyl protease family protein
LALLTIFFGDWLASERNPNTGLSTQIAADGAREVVLERNRYGHYLADGTINGHDVTFIIDTGASDVSIPAHLADTIGLHRGAARVYSTANGPATSYTTTLTRIALGGIAQENIRASINPNVDTDEVLLGMSFLRHLELIQRGSTLTIRQ